MSSFLSRGSIPKKWELLSIHNREWEKVGHLGMDPSRLGFKILVNNLLIIVITTYAEEVEKLDDSHCDQFVQQ